MQEYTQHYLKAGGKQSFLSIALPLTTMRFFPRPEHCLFPT